jgi:CDP-glycerol glycerophosphotransferase
MMFGVNVEQQPQSATAGPAVPAGPAVSVVVIVYNDEARLPTAVRSVL